MPEVAAPLAGLGLADIAGLPRALVPSQPVALVVGLVVALAVAGDPRAILSRRNLVVLLLWGLAPFFWGILEGEGSFGTEAGRHEGAFAFTGIFVYTAFFAGWAFALSRRREGSGWTPNISRKGLVALCVALVVWNAAVTLGRRPDDCGFYTNLGAQRWSETGTLPYGDAKLRGPKAPGYGAAATYGPLLYASHLPAQALLDGPEHHASADPRTRDYRPPPIIATQLTCLAFHLAALAALFVLARRLAGTDVGLGLVALYTASPFVLGLGGENAVIGGVAFISHIAPAAVAMLALAAHRRPALCGALLALAAGVLYFPAFFFPTLLGWYVWRREKPLAFAAGFAVVGAAIVGLVLACTHTAAGESAVELFLHSTLEHQEGTGSREYGNSRFSFWGTHPDLAAFWQTPLFGGGSLFKPTFLAYATLCVAGFFLARGRDVARVVALTAMLGAAVQLWKTHATGSYVEWYYPMLLLAVFARPTLATGSDGGG